VLIEREARSSEEKKREAGPVPFLLPRGLACGSVSNWSNRSFGTDRQYDILLLSCCGLWTLLELCAHHPLLLQRISFNLLVPPHILSSLDSTLAKGPTVGVR